MKIFRVKNPRFVVSGPFFTRHQVHPWGEKGSVSFVHRRIRYRQDSSAATGKFWSSIVIMCTIIDHGNKILTYMFFFANPVHYNTPIVLLKQHANVKFLHGIARLMISLNKGHLFQQV